MDELKPMVDQKKIIFKEKHAENLPHIQADPKLLRIVFQNLLTNAVKYTPDNGTVSLDLRIAGQGDKVAERELPEESMVITVADTGYGIPDNQKDKIFTKLFRADNVREHDAQGTGLGLYIVKAIIEQSGGVVWFESTQNKGTNFYVTLPRSGMKEKKGDRSLA
jgi:signal transduction histidine kinase